MNLTKEQQEIYDGKQGATLAKVMQTLVRYGELFGADGMVPVTSKYNHLVTSFGLKALAPVYELMNQLIESGNVSKQKFSADPRPLDPNVPSSFLQDFVFKNFMYSKQDDYEKQLTQLGIMEKDAYTCTCYMDEVGNTPAMGEVLSWSESSAVVYANSVLGARCNRNSGIIDLMGSVVGYVPRFGLLTDEVSMQNTYQAAKAALKQAEDAYQRMKELYEKGSLAEMKWVEVQSKLQQAQSMEAVARKNLTDCQLYAPFSGVIAEKSLEVGQNVVPGVQVLKLVSDDRLKVRISVPETEIARVARGQKAVIEAPVLNGTKAEGVVTEKGVQANPLSRSYEVNVGIQTKNTGLLPGMVTEVWLQDADKSQACVLPANVLQLDEHNNYFVWLKGADGKASKRVVACGKFTATGVTVVNGLNEGDEVIVEGQQKVCEGTPLAL